MSDTWTILKVLEWTTARFKQAEIASPRLDAELLLVDVLKLERIHLYTHFDKPLSEDELAAYRAHIRRRLEGEPIAYILGEKEFWSIPLRVDSRVLIPRPDTELLVETVVAAARARSATRILDLCTGSGAVAIAVAKELECAVVATDISPGALEVARDNASRAGVVLELHEGDLFAAVKSQMFDVVAANPPYVATADLETVSREVRREPRGALDGGADGLELLRRLIADAPAHLIAGGILAVEHGFDQGAAVRELFASTAAFAPAETRADLAGNPRVTAAARCSE